jgi:hypothetical protein
LLFYYLKQKLKKMKLKFIIPIAIVALLGISKTTFAQVQDADWAKNHPRREEVNGRLANQNARISNKVANGKMGVAEAAKLHSEDHAIRGEERSMAKKDGGHITKADKAKINRQENRVNRRIIRH